MFNPLKVLMMLGQILNMHSILMLITHLGKEVLLNHKDIITIGMEDKLFTIFHLHLLEDKYKTIISLFLNIFGIWLTQMEKSVGILQDLPSLIQTIVFADISQKLMIILEVKLKKEIFKSKMD